MEKTKNYQGNWTYNDYINNDPKALEDLAKNEPIKFSELMKAHYGLLPKPIE